MYTNFYRV